MSWAPKGPVPFHRITCPCCGDTKFVEKTPREMERDRLVCRYRELGRRLHEPGVGLTRAEYEERGELAAMLGYT